MSGPGTPRRTRQLAARPEPGRRRQPGAQEPVRQKTAPTAERGAAGAKEAAGEKGAVPMPRLTGLRLTAEAAPPVAPAVALAGLREGAPGVSALPLPHRTRLEERFGLSLAGEKALSGSAVAGALERLGAEAAEIDGRLYLRSPQAPLPVVAHELVHRLQRQGAPALAAAAATAPPVLAEGSAAESEAHRLAREGGAPETKLGAGTLALLRQATAEEKAETAARRPADTPRPKADARPEPAHISPARAETRPAGAGAAASKKLEAAPEAAAVKPPALVETRLSPEDKARRDAELQAAKDGLQAARSGGDLVDAFAAAPPSVKAANQAGLGERLSEIQVEDQKKLESEIPALEVKMGGEPVAGSEKALAAPAPREVELEPKAPAATELPKLDPLAEAEKFLANTRLGSTIKNLFGFFTSFSPPQSAVEDGFDEVATTDPDVDTSPGEKPRVPIEAGTETDPGRIEEQNGQAIGEGRASGRAAQEAVLGGRGPEAAKLKELSEERRVGKLKQPQAPQLDGAPGAEIFNQLPLEEEVRARFDLDQQASMRESLGPARDMTRAAEAQRDQGRQAQLDEAEKQRGAVVETADQQQRQEVLDARTEIQRQRQNTLDEQGKAIDRLESDAEKERTSSMGAIEKRVETDEEAISNEYDSKEKEAEKKVAEGEKEAEAKKQKQKAESEQGDGWWSRAQAWVVDRLSELGSLIGQVFDRVRGAVKGLLDDARKLAKGLIDQAAGFIKDTIAACGNVLKGFVDFALKDTFPGLAKTLNDGIDSTVAVVSTAVDRVAEELKAGVDAVVDTLEQGIDAVLDVFEGAIQLGLGVLQAAVTGDWGAVFKQLLEAALKVVGIEPQEFYAFAGKVLDTPGLIIESPGQFLLNVIGSVKLGFELFATNFFVHLQAGLIEWLTGSLGGNIRIPEKFDLAGVLSLARQVLGLTGEWLRERARKAIGEKNLERLEFLYSHVETLAQDGFSGLFAKIGEELAGLRDQVLGQLSDFISLEVIKAGAKWLVSLFTPVGALVKVIQTVWNLYQFLRDQLQRIVAVVRSVVDALDKIAHGVIDFAGAKIEMALASLVPIAIDLLARLIPVDGVAVKVRSILEKVNDAITVAVDKLLLKIVAGFVAGAQLAQKGAQVVKEKVVTVAETVVAALLWWKKEKKFTDSAGHDHRIYFRGESQQAELRVQSEDQTVRNALTIRPKDSVFVQEKKQLAGETYTQVEVILEKLYAKEGTLNDLEKIERPNSVEKGQKGRAREAIASHVDNLEKAIAKLSAIMVEIFGEEGAAVLPITEITPVATGARVFPLSRLAKKAGNPVADPNLEAWKWLTFKWEKNGGRYYKDNWVRMHLIHHSLHGDGSDPKNLIVAPKDINTAYYKSAEAPVIDTIRNADKPMVLAFETTFTPQSAVGDMPDHIAKRFPKSVSGEWQALKWVATKKSWERDTRMKVQKVGPYSVPAGELRDRSSGERLVSELSRNLLADVVGLGGNEQRLRRLHQALAAVGQTTPSTFAAKIKKAFLGLEVGARVEMKLKQEGLGWSTGLPAQVDKWNAKSSEGTQIVFKLSKPVE